LEGKTEGNIPFGRSRRRWVDNIKIYFKNIRCKLVNWNHLAQGKWRVVLQTGRTFGFHKIWGFLDTIRNY
jgi:hypothetical protein